MLSQRYKVTQLTAENDLIRVSLDAVGGVKNDLAFQAVVGLRETKITWAVKAREANGLKLGDTYTLTLEADVKAG